MEPLRWEQIEAAFSELVALDAVARRERLAALGATDPALRAAVEKLLAADADAKARLAPLTASLVAPRNHLDQLATSLAGRYRVERELGHGGMATVYLAHDLKHDRAVALKVLKPELAAALGRERFLREVALTARLDHPHIVPLLDSGEAGDLVYYVMPHVDGESLRDRLDREKQLSVEDALQITHEVADALDYAHRHGIVHRDIKPANILLGSGHARVSDFGIARAVSAAGVEELTETGLAIGTPAYMSPEQGAGSRELDGRSDLYALGCVLYEMLAGEPPYTGPSAQAVIAKRLSEPLPRITVVREAVPPRVEDALMKALAKVPADRFKTAAAFAEAVLDPIGEPGLDLAKWLRHRLRTVVVALAAVIVALALLWTRRSGPGSRSVTDAKLTALAVLPCEAAERESEEIALGDRWTEELIRKLVRVGELRPKDWASVRRYRATDKFPRQIGAELNAGALVRCEVLEGAHEVRLAIDLVRADSETVLWSEVYEEPAGPQAVNAVQSAAALGVAHALGVHVEQSARAILRPLTRDTAALRHYRLGRHFLERAGETGDWTGMQRSIEQFDSAVALDSGFAEAYSGLGQALIFLPDLAGQPSKALYPQAARVLRKASALDDGIAEVHSWLGHYLLEYTDDWEGAEQEHRKALSLNPASSEVHLWYGWHLLSTDHLQEAIAEFDTAVALDPLSIIARLLLARSLAFARELDRASKENRQGWEMAPGNTAFAHNEAIIHLLRHHPDSAVEVLERRGDPWLWWNGPLYGLAGRKDVTHRILDSLIARSESGWVDPLAIAVQHLGLGNEDEALNWLEKAYAERSGLLHYLIGPHIFVDSLRGNPRFEELRRRAGFGRADAIH